jgi:hypothetical protein
VATLENSVDTLQQVLDDATERWFEAEEEASLEHPDQRRFQKAELSTAT